MTLPIAIATDFNGGTGDPVPALELISEAGFPLVHWCHHTSNGHMYTDPEIDDISYALRELGLRVLDIHGPDGASRLLASPDMFERRFGLLLVEHWMKMADRLNARVIVLHPPVPSENIALNEFWRLVRESLMALEELAAQYHVRVAFENTDVFPSCIPILMGILDCRRSGWIGACLDSGHVNIHGDEGVRFAQDLRVRKKLYAVHLNDNKGPDVEGDPDTHLLPFDGNIDWTQAIHFVGISAYNGPVSLEVGMRGYPNIGAGDYLSLAYERGMRLAHMHQEVRSTRH